MTVTYELGQTIFILSNKSQSVVPAVITEEFVHKKLNGNVVTYKVAIGPVSKQKIVDLEKIDGEVFTSLDDIRTTLINRLTAFVNELVSSTEERVKHWYGNASNPAVVQEANKGSSDKIDPQSFLEPSAIQPAAPIKQSESKQQNMLREQLRKATGADELEEPVGMVELENGMTAKVRIKQ